MPGWQTFAALRHREYRLLWAGQTAGALAGWMDLVTRGWLMYELDGRQFLLTGGGGGLYAFALPVAPAAAPSPTSASAAR